MRYTEMQKVLGSILVAVYYTDLGYPSERQSGYFDEHWDWEAIKKNQEWVDVFVSTDDPYIPIEQADFIADRLGAQCHKLPGRGHFGSDVLELPELVAVLKERLQ